MTDIKDNPKKFFEEVKSAYIENEKKIKKLKWLVSGVSIKIEGKKQSTRRLKKKVLDECDKIREELIKKVEERGMTFQKDGRLVKIEKSNDEKINLLTIIQDEVIPPVKGYEFLQNVFKNNRFYINEGVKITINQKEQVKLYLLTEYYIKENPEKDKNTKRNPNNTVFEVFNLNKDILPETWKTEGTVKRHYTFGINFYEAHPLDKVIQPHRRKTG